MKPPRARKPWPDLSAANTSAVARPSSAPASIFRRQLVFHQPGDRFSLAQLYQIRGRVGAAARKLGLPAFAPGRTSVPRRHAPSQAIKEFPDRDRLPHQPTTIWNSGGGNLLGCRSGALQRVGYEIYTELDGKDGARNSGHPAPRKRSSEFSLGFRPTPVITWGCPPAADSVQENIARPDGRRDSGPCEELADCYGPLPEAAQNLLRVIGLRNALKPLAARKMGSDGKFLYLYFRESSPLDPARIIALGRKKIKDLRFTPDFKLFWPVPPGAPDPLAQAEELLKMLAQ
jgi:transcription-repair coupling factor (superfamily II helicase)